MEQTISYRRLTQYQSLVEAANARLESIRKRWIITTWQASVAAEVLAGRDVVVKAQTGSGKSMCYLSLAMMHPEDCILVICLLLALMEDQVQNAMKMEIQAVQLSAATMREDPDLLHKAREGEYSMVLVAAEFRSTEAWRTLIRDGRTGRNPSFAQSLRRIVIDEVHLVREWRQFRPHYRNIGLLRTRFPRVPIMACSATLPEATLSYIHKSLHLETPTVLCDMPTDRTNISLFTAPIERGQLQSRAPLLELVPSEAATWDPDRSEPEWDPMDIPKTLVFIDDRMACCSVTTQLINKFPNNVRRLAQEIVCEYHSTMSQKALDRNLQALRNGTCRIMVCTDAVGMGLDVPDIERVVQWRVPGWLTVSGWWQRAGRAARHPEAAGAAIVYYEQSCQVKWDSPFCGMPDSEDDRELVYSAIKEQAGNDDEEEEDTTTGTVAGKRRKKGSLPCEGELLWYLNTRGCLREVAMHYLGSKPEARPAFNEIERGAPCCCRCFKKSNINPDLFQGIPVRKCTPYVGDIHEDSGPDDPSDCPEDRGYDITESQQHSQWDPGNQGDNIPDSQRPSQAKAPGSSARIRLAVRLALRVWRLQSMSKHLRTDNMLQPKHILPDALISRLESRCFDIKTAADLAVALSPRGKDISKHTRIADDTTQLAGLIMQVVDTASEPLPAPRHRGQPFTPPDPKPLYSSDDIAAARVPGVSQMMATANSLLRQFDLTAVNAKETARKKRNSRWQMLAASQVSEMAASQASDFSGTQSVTASIYSDATQRTDRDIMPPPPVPGKRPRGRPPGSKNKVRAGSVGASSVASNASSARSLGSEASDIIQPPSKKRRGRPPGSKNKPKAQPSGDENTDDTGDPNADQAGDVLGDSRHPEASNGASALPETPKRRRGRPLGSKNKPKVPPPEQPQEAIHPLTRTTDTPKRGRGRPRGSKNSPSSNEPQDMSEA
jgi:superfamily II DNA or RNA helicase